MSILKVGAKVKGTDFNGDVHIGIIIKIKNQALGWDEQGNELNKLKYFIENVKGIRFNSEDLELV